MSNRLYKVNYIREVFLKDGTVLKYKPGFGKLKYGTPVFENRESSDWLVLLKELSYVPDFEGYKDRKKRVWVKVEFKDKNLDWSICKVFKESFDKVRISYEIKTIELREVLMRDLVDELKADEFILLMKDNEIKALSLN